MENSKFFYGWWIVGVCLIVLFVTLGLGYYSFGLFFKPLTETFGWSRGAVSGAMSVFLTAWGLACPMVGRFTDRFGPKRLILTGSIGLGTSFCLLGWTNSLWYFYLFYAFAGAASATCSEIPASAAVSSWFSRKRGIAMGFSTTGIGFGGMVLAPLISQSVLFWGWRPTFVGMGLLTWVAIIPLTLFLMKDRPQEMGLLPDGEKSLPASQPESHPQFQPKVEPKVEPKVKIDQSPPNQAPAAADSRRAPGAAAAANPDQSSGLMLIGVAFSLFSFGIIGVLTHEVPYFVDMGISVTTAATLLGLTAGLGVGGKVGLGYVADRLSPKKVLLGCIALQIAGVAILMQARGLAMIWGFVIIFSFAMGATNTLRPLVIGEIFGMNAFGRNLGMIELMRRLGAAVGPFAAGYIFDITRSYRYAFIAFIAAYLAGMLALFWVRPVNR